MTAAAEHQDFDLSSFSDLIEQAVSISTEDLVRNILQFGFESIEVNPEYVEELKDIFNTEFYNGLVAEHDIDEEMKILFLLQFERCRESTRMTQEDLIIGIIEHENFPDIQARLPKYLGINSSSHLYSRVLRKYALMEIPGSSETESSDIYERIQVLADRERSGQVSFKQIVGLGDSGSEELPAAKDNKPKPWVPAGHVSKQYLIDTSNNLGAKYKEDTHRNLS